MGFFSLVLRGLIVVEVDSSVPSGLFVQSFQLLLCNTKLQILKPHPDNQLSLICCNNAFTEHTPRACDGTSKLLFVVICSADLQAYFVLPFWKHAQTPRILTFIHGPLGHISVQLQVPFLINERFDPLLLFSQRRVPPLVQVGIVRLQVEKVATPIVPATSSAQSTRRSGLGVQTNTEMAVKIRLLSAKGLFDQECVFDKN